MASDQNNGDYLLAADAGTFDKAITVKCGGDTIGTFASAGSSFIYGEQRYVLALSDNNLVLTIEDKPPYDRPVVGPGEVKDIVGGSYTNPVLYYGNGGAAEVLSGGTLNVSGKAVFADNSATGFGGAIAGSGMISIEESIFSGNTAANGGAVYSNGTASISGSTFTGNTAANGGAVFNDGGTLTIRNSSFTKAGDSIYSQGTLTVGGNIITASQIYSMTGINFEEGTELVLDISGFDGANDKYFLADYAAGFGASTTLDDLTVSVNVSADQAAGTYLIAGNAAAFDKSVTLKCADQTLFTLELGQKVITDNATYTLASRSVEPADTAVVLIIREVTDLHVTSSDEYVTEERDFKGIYFNENCQLTIQADVSADHLSMIGGDVLRNEGTFQANTVTASGTGNELVNVGDGIGSVYIAENSDLTLNKLCYDELISRDALNSEGTVIVAHNAGTPLVARDLETFMAYSYADKVFFKQDLINVRSMTLRAGKEADIAFLDGYGTEKGDKIVFDKNSTVTLGSEGHVINLMEGKNTMQVSSNAEVAIKSDLTNISSFTANANSLISVSDIYFAAGRKATLKASGISFSAGIINGSDKSASISVGKGGSFTADALLLGESGSTFSVGVKATANILGDIAGVKSLKLANGSYAKNTGEVTWTLLQADNLTGTVKKDSVSFGSYACMHISNDIALGDGNDTLKLGTGSVLKTVNVDFGAGSDSFTLGMDSTAEIAAVNFGDGNNKLSISGGAELEAGDMLFGAGKDTLTLKSGAELEIDSLLCFGAGNDKFYIGSGAEVEIGSLDFGLGNDTLSIGKDSILSVDTIDIDSLDKLTMSKGAVFEIADEQSLVQAQEKWSKYAGQIVCKAI